MKIQTSQGSYNIQLETDCFKNVSTTIKSLSNSSSPKIAVIVDQNVFNIHKKLIEDSLSKFNPLIFCLPQGENSKSYEAIYPIYGKLIENELDRHSIIIGIGGGVIGDAAGFIASTFLRGVKFIQVPTTLLAMVDSSIGGKVGINHELGKNLIGSFYPPSAVIMDPLFLKTLTKREANSGLAECLKHGILSGENLFNRVLSSPDILNLDNDRINSFIAESIQVKKRFVEEDEKETGKRAYLNLGHTFGHAFETYFGYGTYLHGEAVGLGLLCALRLSEIVYGLDTSYLEKSSDYLSRIGLPIKASKFDPEEITKIMSRDKKKKDSKISFILVKNINEITSNNSISEVDILDALAIVSD